MAVEQTHLRPWLTPEQQVAQLKEKGVSFLHMDESEAEDYLRHHNSYFRVRSYRANFSKYVGGEKDGCYVGLDFGMLVELAIIDMKLRGVFLGLTLDVEHYAKIKLLNALEAAHEDGYEVVRAFLDKPRYAAVDGNAVLSEISRGKSSPYTAGLIERHPGGDYAVWEFIELISFGRFIHFYKFCAERLVIKEMLDEFYLLQSVKSLRNACAHNNCVLNDMKAGGALHEPRWAVLRALSKIGIGKDARKTKLSNERMQHFATTLYLHQKMVPDTVKNHRAHELFDLASRMERNSDWYQTDGMVTTGFAFIEAMIFGWYGEGQRANGC